MARIQFRRDTKRNWERANPVLADGEPGYETDTFRFKLGNGFARWADLSYFSSDPQSSGPDVVTQEQLLAHINSKAPHVEYDDLPSLTLLFENGLV